MRKKVCLLAIITLAAGCVNNYQGELLLAGSTCDLPCWYGIKVGETSKEEFLEIIETIPNVDKESISIVDRPRNMFENRVHFKLEGEQLLGSQIVRVTVLFINNRVADLIFYGDLGIELQEIMDLVDEPEFVFVDYTHRGNVQIGFINSSTNVMYWYEAENEHSQIEPETQIDFLEIYQSDIYSEMLKLGLLTFSAYEPERINYFSWKGYGSIKENYWPPLKSLESQ